MNKNKKGTPLQDSLSTTLNNVIYYLFQLATYHST